MNRNIHTIELNDQKTYELDCPNCNQSFMAKKNNIQSAITHKQTSIFCSKECANEGRKVSKDELAQRVINFYNEHNRIPTFKDFKMNYIYRKKFGNWTNVLKYCNLYKEKKEKSTNRNTWERQKTLHFERKKELISMKGGKCQICGYNKNYAALTFHHRDPELKEIALDARSLSNITMTRLLAEIEKCDLLCANCHLEHHNPHLEILVDPVGFEPTI